MYENIPKNLTFEMVLVPSILHKAYLSSDLNLKCSFFQINLTESSVECHFNMQ